MPAPQVVTAELTPDLPDMYERLGKVPGSEHAGTEHSETSLHNKAAGLAKEAVFKPLDVHNLKKENEGLARWLTGSELAVFPKGLGFNSQHPHGSSQSSATPVPEDLTPSYRHTCRQTTTTCKSRWAGETNGG